MKAVLVTLGVIVGILIIGIITTIGIRNGLVSLEENTKEKWAQIDNQLKRRSEMIPGLLETVKGYTKHESDIYGKITDARARLAGSKSIKERANAEAAMESTISRLLLFQENNPELKADKQFTAFRDEWAGTSNRITVARKDYNDAVRAFNTKIRQFPGCLFGFSALEYYEVTEQDKALPEIKF